MGGETHILSPAPAERSDSLSDLLRHAGLALNTRCGGRGACDGCVIELVSGSLTDLPRAKLVSVDPGQPPLPLRSCQCRLDDRPAVIRVPLRSSMRHEPQIVTNYQIRIPFSHDPLWRQLRVPVARSSEELVRAIGQACPDLPIRVLPGAIPTACPAGELFVTVEHRGDHRLLTRVSKTSRKPGLGVAVDIGTTTVALLLVNLVDGAVVGRCSKFNEQIHLGEDVITRINRCSTDPSMLAQLQLAIAIKTILPLLEEALQQGSQSIDEVVCLVFAGNTTMLHLLVGEDPTPMGVAPFTPVFLHHRVSQAGEIFGQCRLAPQLPCHLLPGAAAYVGADLTAGIVASGLLYDAGPSLLIDVGTNGEIILKTGQELVGCATAAGPAFEGARLSSGMRAVDGAISHITFDGQTLCLQCEVIGPPGAQPIGVCGSAYVDFLAHAHAVGLLNDMGRFNPAVPSQLREKLMPWGHGDTAFCLNVRSGPQPIVISGLDIAALLQAKAAIAAGILTLLGQFNLQPSDIQRVYLAGGFGTKLDRAAAIACGLLPGFKTEQICAVGNTALAGAYLFLIDSALVTETKAAAARIRIVELNLDPAFESHFIDQLSIAGGPELAQHITS